MPQAFQSQLISGDFECFLIKDPFMQRVLGTQMQLVVVKQGMQSCKSLLLWHSPVSHNSASLLPGEALEPRAILCKCRNIYKNKNFYILQPTSSPEAQATFL
jgi:hypothetical protein